MNEDPSPSPTTKHPQKLPTGANKADQTKKNFDCGVVYINKWMVENEHSLFEDLTDEHVEADHLQNYYCVHTGPPLDLIISKKFVRNFLQRS
jgi:hypothetical protein